MKFLTKIRYILIALALGVAWFSWPSLARWNFGAAPKEMTFDDYLAGGARESAVRLRGVYVDAFHKVETEMVNSRTQARGYGGSYFPLRGGPDDKRPVKVFIQPMAWTDHGDIGVLALPGEESMQFVDRAQKVREGDLQEVVVSRLRGHEFGGDLEKVLHACSLPTDADLVLVEQNLMPISTVQALGLMAVPPALLALAALPWWLERRRKQAAAPSQTPPPPQA